MHYSFINNGTETRYAYSDLKKFARQEDEDYDGVVPSSEYIVGMDETKLFREKLHDQMVACGYCDAIDNVQTAVRFLHICCKKAELSIEHNTLKNWVTEGRVSQSASARKNYFKLCFALNMTIEQTEEFFLKAILQKPFNYKDLYETVCYFCLRNKRPYSDVERIFFHIQNISKNTLRNIDETMLIAAGIKGCRTEEELIDYWTTTNFGSKQHSAYEEVKRLIEKSFDLAINLGFIKKRNNNKLLSIIYGGNFRRVTDGKLFNKMTITKSSLPDAITRNFIQAAQLTNIVKDTTAVSDDVLRKALILFSFFSYFASQARLEASEIICIVDPETAFPDFIEEVNERLEKCGYVGLYYRNPYDWLFAFCAQTSRPLETLPSLMDEIYWDKSYTRL